MTKAAATNTPHTDHTRYMEGALRHDRVMTLRRKKTKTTSLPHGKIGNFNARQYAACTYVPPGFIFAVGQGTSRTSPLRGHGNVLLITPTFPRHPHVPSYESCLEQRWSLLRRTPDITRCSLCPTQGSVHCLVTNADPSSLLRSLWGAGDLLPFRLSLRRLPYDTAWPPDAATTGHSSIRILGYA